MSSRKDIAKIGCTPLESLPCGPRSTLFNHPGEARELIAIQA